MNTNLKLEAESLALRFRNTPLSPGFMQVACYNSIEKIGGQPAILYGIWCATPFRQRWKKQAAAFNLADALDRFSKLQ